MPATRKNAVVVRKGVFTLAVQHRNDSLKLWRPTQEGSGIVRAAADLQKAFQRLQR